MQESKKEKYLRLIDMTNTSDEVKEIVKDFIKTFDGNNVAEFEMLLITLVAMFLKINELEVKADGYDALEDIDGNFESQLEGIKESYSRIQRGEIPPEPAQNSTPLVNE